MTFAEKEGELWSKHFIHKGETQLGQLRQAEIIRFCAFAEASLLPLGLTNCIDAICCE